MARDLPSTQTFSEILARDPPADALTPGTVIDRRYRVQHPLGSGASSIVYLVDDLELGQRVALKALRQERWSKRARQRFRTEASAAHKVRGPRLLRIHDIGHQEKPALTYLTMEWAERGSLRGEMRAGPMAPARTVDLGIQILEALEELHRQDIVHRDVKPENVLLDARKNVRLADFGLAHDLTPAEGESRAGRRGFVGTHGYAPPEQLEGRKPDPRSDLYSLGVTLREMLEGRLPEIDEPLPYRRTPRWLRPVLDRLTAPDPERRYRSAKDALASLRRARRIARKAPIWAAMLLVPAALSLGHWLREPEPPPAWPIAFANCQKERILEGALGPGGPVRRIRVHRIPSREDPLGELTLEILDPATERILDRKRGLGPPRVIRDLRYSNCFLPDAIHLVDTDRDGLQEILVKVNHRPYFPCFTYHYDPHKSRQRNLYASSGHHTFIDLVDLEGDGSMEMIFYGRANRLGWYMFLAAVPVEPFPDVVKIDPLYHVLAGSPDLSSRKLPNRGTFKLLPPDCLHRPGEIEVDSRSRTISIPRRSQKDLTVSFDNLLDPDFHQHRVFQKIRAARSLIDGSRANSALSVARRAVDLARTAEDEHLAELTVRTLGQALIAAGRHNEGIRVMERLLEGSPTVRPEIVFDAAESLHLAGEIEPAHEWYIRGYEESSPGEAGRHLQEYAEGIFLTLATLGRWRDLSRWIDRDERARKIESAKIAPYRYFAAWQIGRRPVQRRLQPVLGVSDPMRYWLLEARAAWAPPEQALAQIEEELPLFSELRSAAYSLLAEAFAANGKQREAAEAAKNAYEHLRFEADLYTAARTHAPIVRERCWRLAGLPECRSG